MLDKLNYQNEQQYNSPFNSHISIKNHRIPCQPKEEMYMQILNRKKDYIINSLTANPTDINS